jgi:hypothetical protein
MTDIGLYTFNINPVASPEFVAGLDLLAQR